MTTSAVILIISNCFIFTLELFSNYLLCFKSVTKAHLKIILILAHLAHFFIIIIFF